MNTNVHVWVKLTEWGWRIFATHHERMGLDPTPFRVALIDDAEYRGWVGWQRFQLWELMHIFGPAMYNGALDNPFENNEIEFTDPARTARPNVW